MATLRRTETGVVLVGKDGYESREYTYAELEAFFDGVKRGEFDDMVSGDTRWLEVSPRDAEE